MSDKEYTLVIKGKCPAIGADTAVYLDVDRIQHFAGIVDSVLFEGNALSMNDELEARITELENALNEAADHIWEHSTGVPPEYDVTKEYMKYRAIAKGEDNE